MTVLQKDLQKETRNLALVLLALVVALSGCFKSDTVLVVNPDGSGDVLMRVLIGTGAISELRASVNTDGTSESEVLTACDELRDEGIYDIPDGVTVEFIDTDEWCGGELSWDFAAGEGPFDIMLNHPASDPEAVPPGGNGILTRLKDGWYFESDHRVGTPVAEDSTDIEDPVDAMFRQTLEAEVSFSIDLPGQAVDHNADEVEGSVYTWRFDTVEIDEYLFVETRDVQPAAVLPIAAIVGGLGAAIVGAVALRRYLRTTRTPMPAAAVPATIDADSPRRTRDSVVVTGALVLLLTGAPLKLFARLLDVRAAVDGGTAPLAALQPADGAWLCLALVWMVVVVELFRRTALPKDIRLVPHHAQSATRQMVELSLFGVGPLLGWTTANPDVGLEWLEAPATSSQAADADRDAFRSASSPTTTQGQPKQLAANTATPLPSTSAPPVRTEEYVVERGDTFWSLAQATYGDGRHWQKIRDLNLNREVAPGVVLNERSDLSTGWTIALPVIRKKEADNEE